uniref:C2 calcium dependent domain containing 4C n=1 Tax=Callorhinchus milii TaxID=7868 RepID=A0A4W3HFP4_CALMI
MRMWLFEKLRGSVETSLALPSEAEPRDGKPRPSLYSNVLTPDKIPDFFIPPKLAGGSGEGENGEGKRKKPGPGASPAEPADGGKRTLGGKRSGEASADLLQAASRYIIQIESADDLEPDDLDLACQPAGGSPQPHRALAHTPYGCSTLKESPHTRRKESLFHVEQGASPGSSPGSRRKGSGHGKTNGESHHLNPPEPGLGLWPAGTCRYLGGGDSDTGSSAESSPFTSPLLSRSVSGTSLLKMFSHENLSRRLQSLHRNSSLSTDECSSTDATPNVSRRAGSTSTGGAVRLSAEYDCSNARLRVRIITAEELYDKSLDHKSINCCVILYLNPGKTQRQRSTIIKNSRNPIFNEDFFFDGISAEDFKRSSLKLKVVNKASSLKRDSVLGEKELRLPFLLPFF